MCPKHTFLRLSFASLAAFTVFTAERPNILWITCEDTGPQLGCYGDRYATTPNLDSLAAKGLCYRRVWSVAPVCAPARTAIISGLYPTSAGAEHMRSLVAMPPGLRMFPQFLREAGYYCTNNSKEDYNLTKPSGVWDESSEHAHWKNRKQGQPFFAVFNLTVTHESQIRRRPHIWFHDPTKVRVPSYHPDQPEVRQDWAQYYDQVTEMDTQVGRILKELEQAGLTEETIVFFYADHGPGLPRCKRLPYNSGLQVPLIVYIPPKFKHLAAPDYKPGAMSKRLISFVDLAPTVLSLAGIQPPAWMEGRAFLGPYATQESFYLYGLSGRMDERIDMVRSICDGRFIYLRNYFPDRPYGQYIAYMFQTPTTRVWKQLHDEGRLSPVQDRFWNPKPVEELYDLEHDPDETINLADDPRYSSIKGRLHQALTEHILARRDAGFLPESEMHRRAAVSGRTIYELVRDPELYPLDRILRTAELAASRDPKQIPALLTALNDEDPACRFWALRGLICRGQQAVRQYLDQIRPALADPNPTVRVAAAELLGRFGTREDHHAAITLLIDHSNPEKFDAYLAVEALNALDQVVGPSDQVREAISQLPLKDPKAPARANGYVQRLVEYFLTVRFPNTK